MLVGKGKLSYIKVSETLLNFHVELIPIPIASSFVAST